jgi:hypothetical protein
LVAPTIQTPQSARPGKHFTTIDVSRRARGNDLDEKQMLLLFASCQKAAADNGGVDAAAVNHVTDKLS